MGNLFENVDPDDIVVDPEKDYFSELVGDGKKYKDPVAAGRALAEKDAHIARIEREKRELRGNLKSTSTLEEIVNQIRDQRANEQSHRKPEDNQERDPETPAVTKQDIEALLEERLSKRERESTENTNLSAVMELAEKALGPNFQRELEARRKALGLGQDFLTDVAKKSPKTFAKLMELDEKKKEDNLFTPPPTQRNPVASGPSGKRNFAHYQKLRREKPSEYESFSVQKQMLEDAETQGDAFYS